jgi:hypothetical protein
MPSDFHGHLHAKFWRFQDQRVVSIHTLDMKVVDQAITPEAFEIARKCALYLKDFTETDNDDFKILNFRMLQIARQFAQLPEVSAAIKKNKKGTRNV